MSDDYSNLRRYEKKKKNEHNNSRQKEPVGRRSFIRCESLIRMSLKYNIIFSFFLGTIVVYACLISRQHEFGLTLYFYLDFIWLPTYQYSRNRLRLARKKKKTERTTKKKKKTIPEVIRNRLYARRKCRWMQPLIFFLSF